MQLQSRDSTTYFEPILVLMTCAYDGLDGTDNETSSEKHFIHGSWKRNRCNAMDGNPITDVTLILG